MAGWDDPTLGVRVVRDGSTAVLRLRGELDVATAGRLRVRLNDLLEPARTDPVLRLVVDLSRLPFCDLSGIAVLLEAQNVLAARGGEVVLLRPPLVLRRALSALGLAELLPVIDP